MNHFDGTRQYPHLFSPITVRGRVIKNRIVASPHSGGPNLYRAGGNGYSNFTETAALYFGNIARGGAGIVNTGHLGVDPRYYLGSNREMFNFFSSESVHEHVLPVMHLMTDLIHAYGALASIELNHGGYYTTPRNGEKRLGPCDHIISGSSYKNEDGTEIRGLTLQDMEEIADYFAEAAWIGKRGGYDMVNVHAAHNWLLGEFFSPIHNKRTDDFGGSVENRARFPLMVLKRIRERVGDDMLITVRFSASELLEDGITIEEAAQTIRLMEPYADIVQCSAGKIHNYLTTGFTFPMQYMAHGCNAYLAAAIRPNVNVKIETVGGINDPAQADALIANNSADFIAMARSFIADPNWAKKAQNGTAEDIRPCIRCLRCLNYATPPQTGTSVCTVNPHRILPHPLPASELPFVQKKVAVIGGGPAGLQAACELAKKGHTVLLYEKTDKLGGRLEFADHIVFKEDIKRYREYLITQVQKQKNITVRLSTEATRELLAAEDLDSVVVAIGAEDFIPPVTGAQGKNVIHASQVFGNEKALGNHVVIIGGGAVGCETAVHLQSLGKEVDVVEMADELIPDGKDLPAERNFTIFYMTHEFSMDYRSFVGVKEIDRVHIHLKSRCTAIDGAGVTIRNADGEETKLCADTVIMATGFRKNEQKNQEFAGLANEVLWIGDCQKVGSILTTSSSGYYAALQI